MPAPTVALDATPLVGTRTGIGVAVGGMLRELGRRDDLQVVGYGLTTRGWRQLRAALPAGVRPSRAPMPAGALLRVWARRDSPPVEWWTGALDVVHGTNSVVPPSRRAARLVTVWDLTPVRFPEMCTPTSLRYPALIDRAIRSGAWVHTGSHAVAAEVTEHFRADPDRVRVVAPGVDRVERPITRGDGRPYVLALGTAEPRKDFPLLVGAFDRIAERYPELELRIAGPSGWGEADLKASIDASAHRSRIVRTGWVDDPAPLVAGAAVFAYPSRYEGFGFPPLEAMALGTPVVASTAGSLPEVLGDAALLVPPGDEGGLAGALDAVLSDAALRERLVAAGERRVTDFSWASCADGLVRLYRDASGGG